MASVGVGLVSGDVFDWYFSLFQSKKKKEKKNTEGFFLLELNYLI